MDEAPDQAPLLSRAGHVGPCFRQCGAWIWCTASPVPLRSTRPPPTMWVTGHRMGWPARETVPFSGCHLLFSSSQLQKHMLRAAKTLQAGAGMYLESPASSTISCAIQTMRRERLQVELGLRSTPVSVLQEGARTGGPAAAQWGLSSRARGPGWERPRA